MGRISISSSVLGSRSRKGFYGQQSPGFSTSRKLWDSVATELVPCHPEADLWAQVTAEGDPTPAWPPPFMPPRQWPGSSGCSRSW